VLEIMKLTSILRSKNWAALNMDLLRHMDANAALLLAFLCDQYEYHFEENNLTNEGGFICMGKYIDDSLFFKRRAQDTSFQDLRNLGILKTKIVGLPAKRHVIFSEKADEIIAGLINADAAKWDWRNKIIVSKTRHLYFLFQGAELVYIGKSENVKSRLTDHTKSNKEFDTFAVMEFKTSDQLLTDIEGGYIKKYTPKYNIKRVIFADTNLATICPQTLAKHPLSEIKNLP